MDWEAQDEGFLAKIIMDEGSKDVSVGTPVAVVVEEEEHVSQPFPMSIVQICCPPPSLRRVSLDAIHTSRKELFLR